MREDYIPFKRNSEGDVLLCLLTKLNAETSTFFLFVLCAPGRVKVSNTVVSKHDPVFFCIDILFSFFSSITDIFCTKYYWISELGKIRC